MLSWIAAIVLAIAFAVGAAVKISQRRRTRDALWHLDDVREQGGPDQDAYEPERSIYIGLRRQ